MKIWILLLCAAVFSMQENHEKINENESNLGDAEGRKGSCAVKIGMVIAGIAGVYVCYNAYCYFYQPQANNPTVTNLVVADAQKVVWPLSTYLGCSVAKETFTKCCPLFTKLKNKLMCKLETSDCNLHPNVNLDVCAELEERNWPKGSPKLDTCGHLLESFDKPIHIFLSKDSDECRKKCDYLDLENKPHSEAMKRYYYENGKQKYLFPTYPFSAHKNQFVFDCKETVNKPICDWALLESDVMPSVCNLNSKNMICAEEVPVHKSSITGKLYSPLCNLVHPSLNRLLKRADISNKCDLIALNCKGWETDYRAMWWGYFHIHSLEQDPQLYQEIADFMNPDPDKGCFGCPVCKRHFSFELDHPYGDEAMKNMALVLWETHNRATWEIKSWKNGFSLFPGKSDCANCRNENGWVMANVQRAVYSWFDQTADLKYHSKCINYDEQSTCPGECYWNKFWNVCQKQPKM